jgi:hypothetical protein
MFLDKKYQCRVCTISFIKIKNLSEYSGKCFVAFGTGENTSKITRRGLDGEKHLLHSQQAELEVSH